MCGIYGFIGKTEATEEIRQALQKLEYRGYDSWGISVIENKKIYTIKDIGQVPGDLKVASKNSKIGIGHTRWATHGGVEVKNAHPHLSTDFSFTLAQNGIVENYQELKKFLTNKGYKFVSDTDTEVIVRLIEDKLKISKSFIEAVRKAFLKLKGRNTIIILDSKNENIIAVKKGSPLAFTDTGEMKILSSDTLSFSDKANKAVILEDNQMIQISKENVFLFNVLDGREIRLKYIELEKTNLDINLGEYKHYMLKEIIEQQFSLINATEYGHDDLFGFIKSIQEANTIYLVGAGTAFYAAFQIAYLLRKVANKKAIEFRSYEYKSYSELFKKNDLIIVVSQSGETADTIEVVEEAISKKVKVASIINMLGSTISRLSDFAFLTRSGPEICVASTKAFTAQVAFGALIAYTLSGRFSLIKKEIKELSDSLKSYFNQKTYKKIKLLVEKIYKKDHFFVLGREQNYVVALEGALKVKEITYKHFEGFAGGELKHGVIALIEKNTPVFVIISKDSEMDNMLSAAAEVKARGAYVIGISSFKDKIFDYYLPTVDSSELSFIANVIPFQLLSYFLGLKLKRNIDKPRNLAKSVTVK